MPNGKLRFSNYYAHGVVMGLSPHDVGTSTLWEFMACMDGWKAAHQSEEQAPAMSDEAAANLGIEGF